MRYLVPSTCHLKWNIEKVLMKICLIIEHGSYFTIKLWFYNSFFLPWRKVDEIFWMNVVLSELCVFNFYRSLSVIPQKLLRYQLKVIWWGSKFRDDIRLVAIKCFLKFRPSGVEHKAVKNIDNCAMDDLDWHLRKDPSKLVLKYIRCVNVNSSDP